MEFTIENITIESIDKIRSISPHPMQIEIRKWNGSSMYFTSYYFAIWGSGRKKLDTVKRFIYHNDFWIKSMSELSNEEAVKLKHRAYLDKKRMHSKLKELNIKLYQCQITTHIRKTNAPVNFSKVYYKGTEIIY